MPFILFQIRGRIYSKVLLKICQTKRIIQRICALFAGRTFSSEVIAKERKIYIKGVSANIDFYSGFVYNMLNLPLELYTPIFAVSRIAGWSAHRIEELVNAGKNYSVHLI